MEDSILKSVRIGCGLNSEDTDFDEELLMYANSAFFTLHQLGVGDKPFVCTGEEQTWEEVPNTKDSEAIKDYVVNKTKVVFDPPASSYVLEALNRYLSELEWRINSAVDYNKEKEDG